ncbi:MAG: nucleotidyltransferase [Bacteroidales bacterium]|nr:nucleotidyltransferase [Bacteroidales bacterium]
MERMKPTLLVFAAGMGSRYGGLKQMDGMGPSGETIIDYSIYDAVRAGFGKVVYIVREYFRKDMERSVLSKYKGLEGLDGESIEFQFVSQEPEMLPEGFSVPEGREKPWGTAHAILVARDVIHEPFVTINGDDYYGRETFRIAAGWCREHFDSEGKYAVLGFTLDNTLTDAGGVNRGICFYDRERNLESMVQHLKIRKDASGCVRGINAITGEEATLDAGALCSMNMFCLTPDFFSRTDEVFRTFLRCDGTHPGKEFDPPFVFDCVIKEGLGSCEVLSTPSHWFGVTYREDRPAVVERFRQFALDGMYPTPLWK